MRLIYPIIALAAFLNLSFTTRDGYTERGIASFYGKKFHGRATASGETFDMTAMTAAHKLLPFNTLLKVTNLKNDKSVYVRVNDRGPYIHRRIIDLSKAAAERIGLVETGIAPVEIRVVSEIPEDSLSGDSASIDYSDTPAPF